MIAPSPACNSYIQKHCWYTVSIVQPRGSWYLRAVKKAESNLKTQFQEHRNDKLYIAEISGILENDEGTVDLPLAADKQHPPLQQVNEEGRKAITHYRVLERRAHSTLVTLQPETGRTHQLRVHMLALGHPILGDDFYGDEQVQKARPRLCLHAASLIFNHPWSGKEMHFVSMAGF